MFEIKMKSRKRATAVADLFCKSSGEHVGWKVIWNTLEEGYIWLDRELTIPSTAEISPSKIEFGLSRI